MWHAGDLVMAGGACFVAVISYQDGTVWRPQSIQLIPSWQDCDVLESIAAALKPTWGRWNRYDWWNQRMYYGGFKDKVATLTQM